MIHCFAIVGGVVVDLNWRFGLFLSSDAGNLIHWSRVRPVMLLLS